MTHDELLVQIDRIMNHEDWVLKKKYFKALRAVVELAGKNIEHESYVWLDGYDYAMKQIIQAIEKELE